MTALPDSVSRVALLRLIRVNRPFAWTSIEHLVFVDLMLHADTQGQVAMSSARIAERCGCSVQTLRRALTGLQHYGLVRRTVRPGHANVLQIELDTALAQIERSRG